MKTNRWSGGERTKRYRDWRKSALGQTRWRGRWLLAALRSATHVHLGFGSFSEYIERLFGYRLRSTQEKLRVAEALEGLPVVAEALEGGSLNCLARAS